MKNFASEDNTIQYSYSEIGKHHVDTESGNQDSVFIGKVCDNTYCMVVSDGVSSCKYAKAGSEATIETIKSLATKLHLGEMTIVNLDEIKRFIVRDWKGRFEKEWNEYGTTLNFVIVWNSQALIGQIGDGLIIGDIDGESFYMTDMEEGYSVETFALAEVVLKSSIHLEIRRDINSIASIAMTDGIGKELNMESINEFRKYFIELISKNNEKSISEEIELWMKQLRLKNDDDKTIGLLVLEGKA